MLRCLVVRGGVLASNTVSLRVPKRYAGNVSVKVASAHSVDCVDDDGIVVHLKTVITANAIESLEWIACIVPKIS